MHPILKAKIADALRNSAEHHHLSWIKLSQHQHWEPRMETMQSCKPQQKKSQCSVRKSYLKFVCLQHHDKHNICFWSLAYSIIVWNHLFAETLCKNPSPWTTLLLCNNKFSINPHEQPYFCAIMNSLSIKILIQLVWLQPASLQPIWKNSNNGSQNLVKKCF